MRKCKLLMALFCLCAALIASADEQFFSAQIPPNGEPNNLGRMEFPAFEGMLFAGTSGNSADPNDTANGISLIDITDGNLVFNAPGVQSWGATADPDNRRILFSVASNSIGSLGGDELFALSYDGGIAESLGVILNPVGEPLRMDGLAIIDNILFAALDGVPGGGDPDGLYRIDIENRSSELVTSFTGIGGLEADPISGRLFGTDDDNGILVEIDLITGEVIELAVYPKDFTDIDALAATANTLYLITDESQDIQIFDLESNAFTGVLPSPFVESDTFAGAAVASSPVVTRQLVTSAIPALNTWGLLLLSGLFTLLAWRILK